ncbi:MAG TPA: pyridoxal phosphate-dependent aminotransferase [Gammaproteobacteria bacterium]|jgi:aspartate aminotransferase|nr:pyridoxal phosphate-dependent aminotransferase [Gammaproteobacteria bacterium]
MSILLANRIQQVKPSSTMAVAARAEELQAQGKDIISLSVGEPDFDTPEHIKEAAIQAIRDGHTKYTPVDGIKPLKQAIINKFAKENQFQYAMNQIIVCSGAKQCLYNLFTTMINPGDEVIIPAPYWVSYPDMVMLAEGKPVIINTRFSEKFKLSPEQLAAAITDKTRMLILNSPANPSGLAYTLEEWKALAEVLLRHPRILIATDDIYEHSLWNHTPFTNILNACPALYDRCIVVNGVSKAYAMTGWRIGYAAGPVAIIGAMKKAQSQSTSGPASISQYAALAALTGDQSCIKMMIKAYRERHDFLIGELRKIPGVECIPSDGTFYSFPAIHGLLNKRPEIKDDLAFSEYLLDKAELAVIAGSAFGTPGHIRLCYTVSMEKLKEAMVRLHKAVGGL